MSSKSRSARSSGEVSNPSVAPAPAHDNGAHRNALQRHRHGPDDSYLDSAARGLSLVTLESLEADRLGARRPKARPAPGQVRPRPRPEAMTSLADQLDVFDGIGPKLPNQVSTAEFEETMALYEGIRSGDSNILLHADPAHSLERQQEFRNDVMADFARLLSTDQGRGLVGELATGEDGIDHKVVVGGMEGPETGYATVLGEEVDATNGEGTHAGVLYTPNVIQDHRHNSATDDDWAFMGSAETLFHELVHARDTHHGTRSNETVGEHATGIWDADVAVDEYEAVGIGPFAGEYSENQFRAERALVTGNAFAHRDSYRGNTPREAMEPGSTRVIDLGDTPSHARRDLRG